MTPLQWYRHESSLSRLHIFPAWTHSTWDTIRDLDNLDKDDIDIEHLVEHSEGCPPLTTIHRDDESATWSVLPDFHALRNAIDDGDCALIDDNDRHRSPQSLDDVDPDDTSLVALVNDHGNTTLKLHLPASRVVPGATNGLDLEDYPLFPFLTEAEITFCAPSPPCPPKPPIEKVCASDGRAHHRALRAIQRELGLKGIVDQLTPKECLDILTSPGVNAIDELQTAASKILHPDILLWREPEHPEPGKQSRYLLDVDIAHHSICANTALPALPYWIEDVGTHSLRIEPVRAWLTVWAAV